MRILGSVPASWSLGPLALLSLVSPMTPSNQPDEAARQNEDEAAALANHSTTDLSLVELDHDVAVMLELEDGETYWRR
jgi:hypothetical protein